MVKEPEFRRPAGDLESSISLLHRAQAGDRGALGALYDRYFPRLSRWASGRLSSRARHLQDTSDIVQEVLTQFFTRVHGFQLRHDGALMAYLRMAILNRIRDASRRVAGRPEGHAATSLHDSAIESPSPTPLETCVAADTAERYEKALGHLEEDERAAVILRVEMGYSNAEIAAALESPSVDAARMFTHRAIAKLARTMKGP
jgi:RNA polymerase sigma-70 factor (ECF subfamily)